MDKYEYKTLTAEKPNVGHEALNEHGEQGWMLVAVHPVMLPPALVGQPPIMKWCYTFMRKKSAIVAVH